MENIEDKTLEDMRSQINLLKKKLEHETIVNDKMLRKTMEDKAHIINKNAWISSFAALWVILYSLSLGPKWNFSIWFIVATIATMIVCLFVTYLFHRNINAKTLNGDLLTVIKVMRKFRDDYNRWLKIGILISLIWGVWFAFEYCMFLSERLEQTKAIIISTCLVAIGGGIGLFIGWRMHKNMVDNASDIISEIEEYQSEEE